MGSFLKHLIADIQLFITYNFTEELICVEIQETLNK